MVAGYGSVELSGAAAPSCLILAAGMQLATFDGPGTKRQRQMQREHYPLMMMYTACEQHGPNLQLIDGGMAQVLYAQIGVLLERLPVGEADQARTRVAELQVEYREHLDRRKEQ